MPKQNLNVPFFTKSILLPNIMKHLALFLCLIVGLSACSRTKGYFSIHQAPQPSEQKSAEEASKEPIFLAVGDQQTIAVLPESLTDQPAEPMLKEAQVKQVRFASMPTVRLEKQVSKKEVKAIIQQMKLQNKVAQEPATAQDWDPKLKIGVILLGIGVLLSIFGIGLIGGISAFIGLAFTILGLLHTY